MPRILSRRQSLLPRVEATLALLLLARLAVGGTVDRVDLDTASGVFAQRLPFDVPFVVEGQAPPATVSVEVRYTSRRGSDSAFGPLVPAAPLVSGVDAQGRFRVQMPAQPPNRQLQFHVTFERRVTAPGALRAEIEEVLRRDLPLDGSDLAAGQAAALRSALLARYELTLNAGAASFGHVETTRAGADALLDATAAEDAVQREARDLGRDALAAGAARRDAISRWREVSRSLEGQLQAVAASSELASLVAGLQLRPETDPRNGSNRVALSSAARRLLDLEAGGRASVAAGRPASEPTIDLETALVPEDAEAVAERYRASAASLQELREWIQGFVLVTGENQRIADDLVKTGAISTTALEALRALSSPQGSIHRAERWAEALAASAQDVARALRARDQAIVRMASALEARALAIRLRQTLVTEAGSTESGIYVGLDLGVLYPPELSRASLYVGANIYFRPINKRAPLGGDGGFGRRVSLTVGISLNDLKLEEGDARFEPLLGDRSNLLVGAGLRVSRSLRVSAGALLFLKNDQNPLVTDRSLAATFYAALSFDVDVVRALRSMGQ
ncbi:MAG TPA: hypothetical protein VMV21_11290 [Vicinamibacteria bacterium]|nr:hypothetical protein [Vicinamibacteria bacterium]